MLGFPFLEITNLKDISFDCVRILVPDFWELKDPERKLEEFRFSSDWKDVFEGRTCRLLAGATFVFAAAQMDESRRFSRVVLCL